MSERILTLQPEGTSDRPRFSIMDDQGRHLDERNGVWGDRKNATLYSNPADGCRKIQNILLESFGNLPSRRFVTPLYIDLHSDNPVTETEVKDWLYQVVRIATDCDRHGLGPVADSLGLINVDWSLLTEIT
jgi:hypothetical protein